MTTGLRSEYIWRVDIQRPLYIRKTPLSANTLA